MALNKLELSRHITNKGQLVSHIDHEGLRQSQSSFLVPVEPYHHQSTARITALCLTIHPHTTSHSYFGSSMDDTCTTRVAHRIQELLVHQNGVEPIIQFTARLNQRVSFFSWMYCSSTTQVDLPQEGLYKIHTINQSTVA